MQMTKEITDRLCKALLHFGTDIVEIIQFGSSIYVPEYAKDLDILILTKHKRDYSGYFDAANNEDIPFNVDVSVFEIGEKPTDEFIRNVIGACEVLFGSGEYIVKLAKYLKDPTFEEAKSSLRVASTLMKIALTTQEPLDRDRYTREAFDALFHATRIASMTHLSTEIYRCGLVKRKLSSPYKEKFDGFIKVLHVKYSYNGEYPIENLEQEFKKWIEEVRRYVEELESKVSFSSYQGYIL